MFLLGGPAFSGKTLLALLLNQDGLVCLDEPDFHNPSQQHRGMPILRRLFPNANFPDGSEGELTHDEAVAFIRKCEDAILPYNLGMKTAGRTFIEYARIYKALGFPRIALVRDIRDVLAEAPLPDWVGGEKSLNAAYRAIWEHLHLVDLWIRYEDLVTNTEQVMERIAKVLGHDLTVLTTWSPDQVHHTMFKLDRHEMLRLGRISTAQVGIWRSSGRVFSDDTQTTAEMMGYGKE